MGIIFTLSYHLALLAGGYARAERPDEGLAVLRDAFAYIENTGERYYEAEIHRLQGELLLQFRSQGQKSEGKRQK